MYLENIAFSLEIMYDNQEVEVVKNGMVLSALPDDQYLSAINLAGTHDSATAFASFEKLAQCQNKTFAQQIDMGIRFLDVRLFRKRGRFFLVHGKANCYTSAEKTEKLCFDEVFDICVSFLKANPRETIVMSVKQDRGAFEKTFFKAFYEMFIRGKEPLWFLENRVPRLAECRGKIVLMRRCKRSNAFETEACCGLDFSVWEDQASRTETTPLPVYLHDTLSAMVQDRYRLPPSLKWDPCAKSFLDTCAPGENQICLHYLSTCGGKGVPALNAPIVNAAFAEYPLETGSARGWIVFDFPTEALCDKVMQSNFALLQQA